jgi:hypothetical protein
MPINTNYSKSPANDTFVVRQRLSGSFREYCYRTRVGAQLNWDIVGQLHHPVHKGNTLRSSPSDIERTRTLG